MACLGTPPFEALIRTMWPVMVDMSVTILPKLGDDGVDIENAQGLDDRPAERFHGGRPGGDLQRGDDVGHGAAAIAQLDEPVNKGADLDALWTMGGGEDVAPGERSFGEHGLPLDPRARREQGP